MSVKSIQNSYICGSCGKFDPNSQVCGKCQFVQCCDKECQRLASKTHRTVYQPSENFSSFNSRSTSLAAPKEPIAWQSSDAPLPSQDSHIPPPPSGKDPFVPIKKADVTFADEIVKKMKEMEAKKASSSLAPAPNKKKPTYLNTMGRALNRRSMAQRPQSEKVQFKNMTEGFLVKASEVTLKEIEEQLGIEFEETDKKKSFSDLIFDKNRDYPEEGTFFEFEGFMIQIVKVAAQGIEKVMVRFPTE